MTAHAARGPGRVVADRAPRAGSPIPCEINTTPLIDVPLVLLVTLIISLPSMTHAVKLDLPHGGPPPGERREVINLEIDSDGTVVWNGTVVPGFGRLGADFEAAAGRRPQPEIHLRADRRARYDVVARVLASAQHSGMQRIGFVDTGTFGDH